MTFTYLLDGRPGLVTFDAGALTADEPARTWIADLLDSDVEVRPFPVSAPHLPSLDSDWHAYATICAALWTADRYAVEWDELAEWLSEDVQI